MLPYTAEILSGGEAAGHYLTRSDKALLQHISYITAGKPEYSDILSSLSF